jgi:hypothetical protein
VEVAPADTASCGHWLTLHPIHVFTWRLCMKLLQHACDVVSRCHAVAAAAEGGLPHTQRHGRLAGALRGRAVLPPPSPGRHPEKRWVAAPQGCSCNRCPMPCFAHVVCGWLVVWHHFSQAKLPQVLAGRNEATKPTRKWMCCFVPAVAEEGPGFLYRAPAAAALAAEVQAEGGVLTAEDLAAAQVEVTQPLTVQVRCSKSKYYVQELSADCSVCVWSALAHHCDAEPRLTLWE